MKKSSDFEEIQTRKRETNREGDLSKRFYVVWNQRLESACRPLCKNSQPGFAVGTESLRHYSNIYFVSWFLHFRGDIGWENNGFHPISQRLTEG